MVITEYDSGCLRSMLITANGYRKNIPESSMELGRVWEDTVFDRLLTEQPWPFHRELPFKYEVDGVVISGRCDFVVYDDKGPLVLECKATASKYAPKDIIKDGKYKINHLAQVTNYLTYWETDRAEIMVSYMGKESRTFQVGLTKGGQITVDKKDSGFNIHDQMQHTKNAAKALKENIVWDRPHTMKGDACRYCNHAKTCLKWDLGELTTTEEFINDAKAANKVS
jgi:CRISPR/Cas system-associated exonuclease Cas4 (RecB family)